MSNYTLFPDNDKKQVNGSSITATSTKINGGSAFAIGTSVPSNSAITAKVRFGDLVSIFGTQVVKSKNLFGAFHSSTVTITSVADNGSGFCRYTLNSHGLSKDTVINVSGSTSGNLDGPQKITAVTTNTFDTDKPFVSSATPGVYSTVAGRFASMTTGEFIMLAYSSSVAGGQKTRTGFGADYGIRRSIHKLEHMRTVRVATAIRAGYWNVYTGKWTTDPAVADDAPTWGTDDAATPTRAKPGELVYRHSGMSDGTYGPVQKDYPAKTNG